MIGCAFLYACLSEYSEVVCKFWYRSSGVSKNPFAVAHAVFCAVTFSCSEVFW